MWESGKRDVALQTQPLAKRMNSKQIALAGERLAAIHFEKMGYTIIERNWRSGRFCEIDLICRSNDGLLVFVEVKTRRWRGDEEELDDSGFDSVHWQKRRKICIAVRSFLARTQQSSPAARIDVVVIRYRRSAVIDGEPTLSGCKVMHVAGAFDSI
jgi:uncharacterized protein (TIGR00252 family)